MKRTTLKDIAKALNLSVMTVSRAINNHPDVSEATRRRVLRKIRELDYHPDQLARSLVTRRSFIIGLVIPNIMNPLFSEVTKAVESVANARGYNVFLCHSEDNPEKERKEIESLMGRRVDGLIISPAQQPKDLSIYNKLNELKIPFVFIVRRFSDFECNCVVADELQIGYLATEHLIKLGYKEIGHIRGPEVYTSENRFLGYKKALADYDLKFNSQWVKRGGFHEEDGYRAMKEFLAMDKLPRAIFAVNDPAAIGALMAIEEAGLSVPKDIALIGVGNIAYASVLKVPLTTVDWPKYEIGRLAAEMLIERIEAKKPQKMRAVVVKPKLIVRGSCGSKLRTSAARKEAS